MTAVATAVVGHPNQNSVEGELLGMKARVLDVTASATYTDNGDVLTAAALGWDGVFGAIMLTEFVNSTGELTLRSSVRNSTTQDAIYFRLYVDDDADATGGDEVADSSNNSGYAGRFVVLGF